MPDNGHRAERRLTRLLAHTILPSRLVSQEWLAGWRSGLRTTCTGLGTRLGGGFSQKECFGGSPTPTCVVCGTKPFLVNDTDWISDGTVSSQGVLHVRPCAVRTSAPGGSDSNRKDCIGAPDDFDDIQLGVIQPGIDGITLAHPESAKAITATVVAATNSNRDMTPLPRPSGQTSRAADVGGKAPESRKLPDSACKADALLSDAAD
jgi:hypothetical protein